MRQEFYYIGGIIYSQLSIFTIPSFPVVMKTYLIIDDERLACYRLRALLEKCNIDSSLIYCNSNPKHVIKENLFLNQDILFLDIDMPEINGLDFYRLIKEKGFNGKVIFTTVHNHFVLDALREHAFDYLLKPIDRDELLLALNRVKQNETEGSRDFDKLHHYGLTQREIEICKLIFKGLSSQDIGDALFISKHTVDTHRRNILHKTGCKNTTELFTLL
jgi:two-component system, NarL family, nitrate/nitrite response regulator NarL